MRQFCACDSFTTRSHVTWSRSGPEVAQQRGRPTLQRLLSSCLSNLIDSIHRRSSQDGLSSHCKHSIGTGVGSRSLYHLGYDTLCLRPGAARRRTRFELVVHTAAGIRDPSPVHHIQWHKQTQGSSYKHGQHNTAIRTRKVELVPPPQSSPPPASAFECNAPAPGLHWPCISPQEAARSPSDPLLSARPLSVLLSLPYRKVGMSDNARFLPEYHGHPGHPRQRRERLSARARRSLNAGSLLTDAHGDRRTQAAPRRALDGSTASAIGSRRIW